jgi:hypothetical protein
MFSFPSDNETVSAPTVDGFGDLETGEQGRWIDRLFSYLSHFSNGALLFMAVFYTLTVYSLALKQIEWLVVKYYEIYFQGVGMKLDTVTLNVSRQVADATKGITDSTLNVRQEVADLRGFIRENIQGAVQKGKNTSKKRIDDIDGKVDRLEARVDDLFEKLGYLLDFSR